MAAQANIRAVITAEDRASKIVDGFGNSVSNAAKKIALMGAAAATAAAAGIGAIIKYSFDSVRSIQKSVAGIQALAGSAEEAGSLIKDMVDFVRGKPFDRLDTINAAKQLMAYGRTAQDVRGDIELLGRAVVISGADWNNLARVYGRVSSTGRIMNDDFQILTDSGIALGDTLSKNLGISIAELRKRMADGQVTFEDFRKALSDALPADAVTRAGNTIDNKILSLKASFRDLGFSILGVDFSKVDESGRPLVREGGLLDKMQTGIEKLTSLLRSPEVTNAMTTLVSTIATLSGHLINVLSAAVVIAKQKFDEFRPTIEGLITWVQDNGPRVIDAFKLAWDQIFPSLIAVFNTLQTQIFPTLQRLWKEVLEPLIPVIGVVFVAAWQTALKVMNVMFNFLDFFINRWIDVYVNAREAAGVVARAAETIYDAVNRFFGGMVDRIRDGVNWFNILKDTAIGVADAISPAFSMIKDVAGAISNVGGKLNIPGFAMGGFTGRGGSNEVAGIVHKGEYVLPRQMVNQNTGTPKVGGSSTVNVSVNVGTFAGSPMEFRKLTDTIARTIKDLADQKGMTPAQFLESK